MRLRILALLICISVPVGAATVSAQSATAASDKGWIGVELQDAPDVDGTTIVEIVENGPADKAGLRKGDIIAGVNGVPLFGMSGFSGFVAVIVERSAGRELDLRIDRSGTKFDVKVPVGNKVAAQPPSTANAATQTALDWNGSYKNERGDALLAIKDYTFTHAFEKSDTFCSGKVTPGKPPYLIFEGCLSFGIEVVCAYHASQMICDDHLWRRVQ